MNIIIFRNLERFRKGRSTIGHLSSLTIVIETRKQQRKSTFCAFIDFRKAYDSVNREILWTKLEKLGLNKQLLYAFKSLYNNVLCSVKLNVFTTDWFSVNCGSKQGCSLSPVVLSFKPSRNYNTATWHFGKVSNRAILKRFLV